MQRGGTKGNNEDTKKLKRDQLRTKEIRLECIGFITWEYHLNAQNNLIQNLYHSTFIGCSQILQTSESDANYDPAYWTNWKETEEKELE